MDRCRERFNVVKSDTEARQLHVNFCLNLHAGYPRIGQGKCRGLRGRHRIQPRLVGPAAAGGVTKSASRSLSSAFTPPRSERRQLAAQQVSSGLWSTAILGPQRIFPGLRPVGEIASTLKATWNKKPGDLLIADSCAQNECLYMTQGSLVQRRGEHSQRPGEIPATAWNFVGRS